MNKPKRSPIFKAVSLFLVLAFSLYNVSFAVTQDNIGKPDTVDVTGPLSVEDIGIAIDCGTIKSRFNGDADKVIVHIQDAHCNYEAQSNINRMLDQITKECGIGIISVEGAEGIVDTTWFRAFPDAEIRKEVATYFMKKGEITGAEFFSITSDFRGTIFGAETRDYYVRNLRAFTDVYPYKETIENYFTNVRTVANRLKSVVYPAQLRELDQKIRAFDDKDIELSDYAEYLNKMTRKYRVDLKDCGNFDKLTQTLEYENKIDFDTVDQERSEYIDVISKKLSKEDMTELVTQSIRFKKGHIKAVDFYSYLRDLAKDNSVDMVHEYPNLFYYYIYTKLYDGIDNEGLFREIDLAEIRLKDKLFKDETQRKLDKYSRMVDMFVDLTNIELTNEDYDTFKGYSKEFSLEDTLEFFKGLVDKYNLNYAIDGLPVQIGENIPKMVDFYEIAIKRDNALIDNTLDQMKKEKQDRCVLIAGGFHTRGIKDILEKKGVSYVVVTPKITKNVDTPYIKVLTNQRTSLEDIITESAVVPGIGITASREEIVRPKGDMLSPLARVAYTIPMYLNKPGDLKELSDAVGAVQGRSLEDAAVESYKEMIAALVRGWLMKVRENAAPEVWATAIENWHLLLGAYLKKYEEEAAKQGVQVIEGLRVPAAMLTAEQAAAVSQEFRAIFEEEVKRSKTPGAEAIRLDDKNDLYESLTPEEAAALDEVIAGIMSKIDTTRESRLAHTTEIMVENVDANTGKTVKKAMEVWKLPGFREAIEKYNAAHEARIPLDVRVHPGTGRGTWTRMYIDERDFAALDETQAQRLANHEYYHILNPDKSEKDAIDVQKDDLMDVRLAFIEAEKERLRLKAEEEKRVKEALLTNSKAMAEAADKGVGPDIVMIVSSTDEQADFWQKRLTGKDAVHGSGEIVKTGAVVLSVPESNWKGGAGNGLGTLNGFVQAARKARDLKLIDVPDDAPIEELIRVFMFYIRGKSSFMFHTAGKGTRTAPLPGAEVNSKPNIKLPKMVEVEGKRQPVTILESVLMETSIYAPSRKNRLSVFWGDQVIVNEENIDFGKRHHVEIFGQKVPLDREIEAYGVLIPGEEGDCKQREKLALDDVKKVLPAGSDEVYKSIGSFTVSLGFLNALMSMKEHMEALKKAEGSLNTDPDWWQPLTSARNEYIEMQGKKGVDAKKAGAQWDRMNKFWEDFEGSGEYLGEALDRKIGFNDVGPNSYWWDYGQNKFYLRNMQILTEDSMEGEAARNFFGVEEGKWVDASSDTGEAVIENSIVQNSAIKKGSLKNCVVIDCTLDEVYAENAVIIGSTILKLNADGALCYNVVDHDVSLREGQLLANIFHPELGRFAMRTDTTRDGQTDWNGKVYVYDNQYTYPQVSDLMKGVKMEDVEQARQNAVANLRTTDRMSGAELAQRLSDARGISIESARELVARRMLVFGDIQYFYDTTYMDTFGVSKDKAEQEVDEVGMAGKGVTQVEYNTSLNADNMAGLVARLESAGVLNAVRKKQLIAALTYRKVEDVTDEDLQKYVRASDLTDLNFLFDVLKETDALYGIDLAELGIAEKTQMVDVSLPEQAREEVLKKSLKEGLRFGTSGLRDFVENMPDVEVYINTRGFVKFLKERGEIDGKNNVIGLAGDLRASTPRIIAAVAKAIEDEGCRVDFQGLVPSPTIAYYAMQKDMPSIMVTGSHIPEVMNGIKFTRKSGEVLKSDEDPINEHVKEARAEEYAKNWDKSLFNGRGMFNVKRPAPGAKADAETVYVQRYLDVFPKDALKGKKVVFYQHKAVGRDITAGVFAALGATVIIEGRSEKFVPIDTEKVPDSTRALFREWAKKHDPDLIIFTDGDSDRPGLVDETGEYLTGDCLGALVSMYLKPQAVGLPVSANDAVVEALKASGIKVTPTRIGSPYVIAAMNGYLAADPDMKVAGWESNGGYLLGSDWTINGKTLKALPTRDAILPLLVTAIFAKEQGVKMSELIASRLPARYVVSDAVNNKMEGCEAYTPDMGKRIVKAYTPEGTNVVQVEYRMGPDERTPLYYVLREDGTEGVASPDMAVKLENIRQQLAAYFPPDRGLGEITYINFMDGIKMRFASEDGIHIRPSGNEPIMRFYVQSPRPERAKSIVDAKLDYMRPLIRDFSAPATPGMQAVRVDTEMGKAIAALDQAIKEGKPVHFVPSFRTGKDGYTWGQDVRDNFILGLMGAKTAEERIALAEKYGIPANEVIGERWITSGLVEAEGKQLPNRILALWPEQVPGSKITAKALTSGRPLSLQYHRFPEMIVPLEDGYAYLGLNKDVTPQQFMDNLRKGDVSMFNRVELRKGRPVIVPPYMIHAYGIVRVYEVKAVTAAEDKAGTISFYDRLRLDPAQQAEVAKIVEDNTPDEAARILVAKGIVRPKKDVLTLPAETTQAIAAELERAGALNRSDLSVAYFTPVVVTEQPGVKYEIMGQAPGFVTGRYTLDEAKTMRVAPAIQGKQHSVFVTEGTVRILNDKGEEIDVLTQGEERMFPTSVGTYSITAVEGSAAVYTQYTPETPTRATPIQMETGERTIADLAESVPSYVATGVVTPEDAMTDVVEVNTAVRFDVLPVQDGRDFVVDVVAGSISLIADGERLAVYEKGDTLLVSEDNIIDNKGRIIDRLELGKYELVKEGTVPATVEVRYPKTEAEKIVYTVYDMLKKHIDEIKAGQVDLILPDEMFVPGGKNSVGSALWEQEQLRRYVSDKIRISTYSSHMGLKEAAKKSLNKGAVGILVATESNIKDADRDDPELRDFLQGRKGTLRTLAIPDLDDLGEKGWYFNREVEGTALLLASVTPEQIKVEGEDNAADDLQRLMSQLVGKPVPRQYLYYMLSYDEIGDMLTKLPAELQEDPYGWLRFVVQNLLLKMPIKPFDATEQLHQRRKIMWSV